jgi:acryloyl-coenzyme A reductase
VKAVRLRDVGRVEVEDVEVPQVKPLHVLIKLPLTGICYRDLLTVEGHFPRVKRPVTLGHEIAGTVVEVGDGVEGFRVGDRVASLIYVPCGLCELCKGGQENLCRNKATYGEDVDGSYTEYLLAHMNSLVKIPEGVSWEAATIAACLTGMLLRAFRERGGLTPGQNVCVTGAGGGVGIHAIQIAKVLGARVIGVTTSPWKADKIREAGADEVVVAPDGTFSQQVKGLTGGYGADVVLESVGRPTFTESLRSVKWGGRVVVVGNVDPSSADLPLGLLILRENAVAGSLSSTRRYLMEALELSASGKFKPFIHQVLPLEEAVTGLRMLKSRGAVGRILLRP